MEHVRAFLQEEDGVGVVEIILILVVLIGLVVIFKDQLTRLVNNIFKKINNQSNGICRGNRNRKEGKPWQGKEHTEGR